MKKLLIALGLSVIVLGTIAISDQNNSNATEATSQQENIAWTSQSSTRQCPRCAGTGNCNVCQGRGYFTAMGSGEKRACRTCHGTGKCQNCGGSGRVSR